MKVCSPATHGMDIYSIHLALWLKIPLLSEKPVERVSFHSLPFDVFSFSATKRELAAFCTFHYHSSQLSSLLSVVQNSHSFCFLHLCPLRSESQRVENRSHLLRRWVPNVRMEHWQGCWRMFLLLYNDTLHCGLLLQFSVALNSLRLYLRCCIMIPLHFLWNTL